ncbi:MAG: SDR family oxidoreductase [Lachnospiraceae bacterium]|nr:SDR family oxidoreductase [Lachnospiraceae bacterium]
MEKKVALVTGARSGIGNAAAKALKEKGVIVYTFGRTPFEEEGIRFIPCDVSDEARVKEAVAEIIKEAGRIDILVNNAGFGISGAIEFTALEDAKKQFDVNFFGTVNVTKAVLPGMRAEGGGRIINVSSMAAPAAIPFQAYYSASKAAVSTYTEALRNEVRPFGISCAAVLPGDIRTGFTAAREKQAEGDEAYGGRISRSVARMEKDEQNGRSPEQAGKLIAKLALKKRVKPLYAIDFVSKCEVLLFKLLPARFANYIVGKIYAD